MWWISFPNLLFLSKFFFFQVLVYISLSKFIVHHWCGAHVIWIEVLYYPVCNVFQPYLSLAYVFLILCSVYGIWKFISTSYILCHNILIYSSFFCGNCIWMPYANLLYTYHIPYCSNLPFFCSFYWIRSWFIFLEDARPSKMNILGCDTMKSRTGILKFKALLYQVT